MRLVVVQIIWNFNFRYHSNHSDSLLYWYAFRRIWRCIQYNYGVHGWMVPLLQTLCSRYRMCRLHIKYKWGIGAKDWFKPFPWLIVAANIMIAVVSDLESAVHAFAITGDLQVLGIQRRCIPYGGWWECTNAIAGLINIFCMTGWWGIYHQRTRTQKICCSTDMIVWFIVDTIFGTSSIHMLTYLHIHGIVVLHFFLLLHLLTHFGTRVVGSRTVLTHLQSGVCSLRYSHCSS